jgi:cytochrome c biogenesis protein CcdA
VVALTGTVLLALTAALPATAVGGLLLGLGLGAVGAPAIGSVFRTVPAAAAAQGSALLYVVNQLGAALGIAAAALVVAAGGTGFWLLTGGVVAGLLACSRLPQPAPTPAVARG